MVCILALDPGGLHMGYAVYADTPVGTRTVHTGTLDVTNGAGMKKVTTVQMASAAVFARAWFAENGVFPDTTYIEWPYLSVTSTMSVDVSAKMHAFCGALYVLFPNAKAVPPRSVKGALGFPARCSYDQRKRLGARIGEALAKTWGPVTATEFAAMHAKPKQDAGDALIILTWVLLGSPSLPNPDMLVARLAANLAQETTSPMETVQI